MYFRGYSDRHKLIGAEKLHHRMFGEELHTVALPIVKYLNRESFTPERIA